MCCLGNVQSTTTQIQPYITGLQGLYLSQVDVEFTPSNDAKIVSGASRYPP